MTRGNKEARSRAMRYKRPALASLGAVFLIQELEEIAEACDGIKYYVEQNDDETLPEGMTEKDYMGICFAMIDAADVVVLLPDAHLSKGAMLEMMCCQYIGKPVRELEGWQWAKSN